MTIFLIILSVLNFGTYYEPETKSVYRCDDKVIISLIDGDLLVLQESAVIDFLRVLEVIENGGIKHLQFLAVPVQKDKGIRYGLGLNFYDEYPEMRPGGYELVFIFNEEDKANWKYDENGILDYSYENHNSLFLTLDKTKIMDADEEINRFLGIDPDSGGE